MSKNSPERTERREWVSWRDFPALVEGLDMSTFARSGVHRPGIAVQEPGTLQVGEITAVTFPPVMARAFDDCEAASIPKRGRALVDEGLGTEWVVLVQAGAAALGLWIDDALTAHKAIKKYVVRGKGRAQPTHLKTRGKSRYGSRLRLQNHRALLGEVNERLGAWLDEDGAPDLVHLGMTDRMWPEVRDAEPPWPLDPDHEPAPRRIALDVHVPDHRELLRVRHFLTHALVLRKSEDDRADGPPRDVQTDS